MNYLRESESAQCSDTLVDTFVVIVSNLSVSHKQAQRDLPNQAKMEICKSLNLAYDPARKTEIDSKGGPKVYATARILQVSKNFVDFGFAGRPANVPLESLETWQGNP